jgi:hypothetical protein
VGARHARSGERLPDLRRPRCKLPGPHQRTACARLQHSPRNEVQFRRRFNSTALQPHAASLERVDATVRGPLSSTISGRGAEHPTSGEAPAAPSPLLKGARTIFLGYRFRRLKSTPMVDNVGFMLSEGFWASFGSLGLEDSAEHAAISWRIRLLDWCSWS